MTKSHFSFAIWTDGALACDELRAALVNLGHTTVSAASNHDVPVDVLVIMERGTDFHIAHPGVWLRLANSARATVMVATTKGRTRESLIPVHATMTWNGEIRDLPEVAGSLAAIAPAVVGSVPDLPHVFGVSSSAGIDACGREEDLELLLRLGRSRLVPVSTELIDRFQRISRASSRMQYLLSRLVEWSLQYRGRALVKQRLGVLGAGSNLGVAADRSLFQILNDTRTTSLITLVGEPGVGKTQQMRHLDAQSALLAIRDQDAPAALQTFYLPLFEHPAHTEVSISWMVERWNTMVDPHGWCSLEEFIADGGVILMDGYNEVGSRAMRLEDWMFSWRAAVSQIFARGARRVVVSCRTRDQIIPLPSAHGEGITAVAVSPLSAAEVTALAAYTDADIAAELRRAIELDSDLLAFYANPFRLQTFLQSGASAIATTDARLFGASIVAAIMREREQLHFDSALLPDRAVVELIASCVSIHANPWPLLGELPLIRLLAELAKTMAARAGQSDWLATSTMRRGDARRVLEAALATEGITSRNANDVIRTGRDLHIIVEQDAGELAFSHRIVQELFAALGLDTAESLELLATHPAARHPLTRPCSLARSSASGPGLEGLAYALAEIKGEAFTESLADVSPLLAARAHAAARFDFRSAAGDTIRARLVDALLQTDMLPEESVAVLRVLALAGWPPPVLSPSTGAAGLHRIPGREWRLGAHIEVAHINAEKTPSQLLSERRTIELPGFWISDCPVTVREYTDFISAGGYNRADLWTVAGWDWRMRRRYRGQFVADWAKKRDTLRAHPERIVRLLRDGLATPARAAALVRFMDLSDEDLLRHAQANNEQPFSAPRGWPTISSVDSLNPVVGVSWFEANAFCAWKSATTGLTVRLPSENEWEATCVWRLQQLPVCEPLNSTESGFGGTIPVGATDARHLRDAAVPKDLLGNSFEWMFDPYRPGDDVRKILKGGSWRQERWRAHPAYRGRGTANYRSDDTGFRYVVEDIGPKPRIPHG